MFKRGDVLMGAPFDASSLKVTRPAVPLIEGVTRGEWLALLSWRQAPRRARDGAA